MNESLFVTMVKDLKGLIVKIYICDAPIVPTLIPLPPNLDTLVDIHVVKVYIRTHIDAVVAVVIAVVIAVVSCSSPPFTSA